LNWASIAVLSAAIMGIVSIIDGHLLSRRVPGLRVFILVVGIIHLVYGLIVLYILPLPAGVSVWPVLAAAASGMIRSAGIMIMLYNLKVEEVSRVIPIVNTSPVFVALLAVPLLGETLGYLQWLAIIIVVAGAVIISAERSPAGVSGFLGKPFLLLFVSSLLIALADVASKYSLSFISFWNLFAVSTVCMSSVFLLFSLRPQVLNELWNMERRSSSLALLFFNEMLAPIGILCGYWAMKSGPVSLVATIRGSRPVFVAIYSLILGLFLPDFLIRLASRKVLTVRLVATLMIFGGISIIYLT